MSPAVSLFRLDQGPNAPRYPLPSGQSPHLDGGTGGGAGSASDPPPSDAPIPGGSVIPSSGDEGTAIPPPKTPSTSLPTGALRGGFVGSAGVEVAAAGSRASPSGRGLSFSLVDMAMLVEAAACAGKTRSLQAEALTQAHLCQQSGKLHRKTTSGRPITASPIATFCRYLTNCDHQLHIPSASAGNEAIARNQLSRRTGTGFLHPATFPARP